MARQDDSRLARIKKKLENTDFGGGDHNFWKPKVGANTIRIVDGVGDMELFWQEVGKHWIPNTKKFFYCNDFTTDGEHECPICEIVASLYAAGNAADKAIAGDLRTQNRWVMNVIVRGQEPKGPQIAEFGPMIFKQISAKVMDPDYGTDIFDADNGVDLVITRTGTGKTDTSYDVSPKRKNSPMHEDPAQIDQWFDEATDLSYVMLSDDPAEDAEYSDVLVRLIPYDRLLDEFEMLDADDTGADAEDTHPFPDEEEEPVRSRAKRGRGDRRSRRRR